MLAPLKGGNVYTAVIGSQNRNTGVALAELYEVTTTGTARITALSCRAHVGVGDNILIPGLIIAGTGAKRVLIRGSGATNAGVSDILLYPYLALYSGGTKIAENTAWNTASNATEILAAREAIGTVKFPDSSSDCEILTSLPAGGYTIQRSGVGGTQGLGLIEIYEVP